MMAKTTHKPPINPTTTHVNIGHKIWPSLACEMAEPVTLAEVELKKSFSHLVVALLWLVAEMAIHVAAIAKAAKVKMMFMVVYRRKRIDFSLATPTKPKI